MPRPLEAKPIDGIVQEEQRPEAELGEFPGYKYKVEECEPESEKGHAQKGGNSRECGVPQLRKNASRRRKGSNAPKQ